MTLERMAELVNRRFFAGRLDYSIRAEPMDRYLGYYRRSDRSIAIATGLLTGDPALLWQIVAHELCHCADHAAGDPARFLTDGRCWHGGAFRLRMFRIGILVCEKGYAGKVIPYSAFDLFLREIR